MKTSNSLANIETDSLLHTQEVRRSNRRAPTKFSGTCKYCSLILPLKKSFRRSFSAGYLLGNAPAHPTAEAA